jgi:hypothetical protein
MSDVRFTTRDLPPGRQREIAYHEAGHTIAYAALGLNPGRVTIETNHDDPMLGRAGHRPVTLHRAYADLTVPHDARAPEVGSTPGAVPPDALAWMLLDSVRREIVATLAGTVAELRVAQEHDEDLGWVEMWLEQEAEATPGDDWSTVRELLARIDGPAGAVDDLLDRWRGETEALLTERWADVVAVAEALLEHGTLSEAELDELLYREDGDAV